MKRFKIFYILIMSAFSSTIVTAQEWVHLVSGTNQHLLHACFLTNDLGFVCGAAGTLLKTTDGGETWNPITTGTSNDLYRTYFQDEDHGIVVGNNGTARKTINGGQNWTTINLNTTEHFRDVFFWTATDGIIIGGNGVGIVRTTDDGGQTWQSQDDIPGEGLRSACMNNGKLYFIGFEGNLFEVDTTDFSFTTHDTEQPAMVSIDWNALDHAIAIGGNGFIKKTTDGGVTWTYVESNTNNFMAEVRFLNSTDGFIACGDVANNTGLLLKTNDGGETWTTIDPDSHRLYALSLYSNTTLIATGLNGTILKFVKDENAVENSIDDKVEVVLTFPNPTHDQLHVSLLHPDLYNAAWAIELTDMEGRIVLSENFRHTSNAIVQVGNIAAGTYFVHVKAGNDCISRKKIVIN